MASTQYDPVIWQKNDLVTTEKLAAMSNNIDFLRDNTPRVDYRAFGLSRVTGVKIICGMTVIHRTKDSRADVTVSFPDIFTTDCNPIITTGLVTDLRRVHLTLTGIHDLVPSDDGFKIHIRMDNPDTTKNKIASRIYVSWQAMGY